MPSLEDLKKANEENDTKKSQKTGITQADRARLGKEKQQFSLVLGHPLFRANPIGTIKEHLENEMAIVNASHDNKTKSKKNKDGAKPSKK